MTGTAKFAKVLMVATAVGVTLAAGARSAEAQQQPTDDPDSGSVARSFAELQGVVNPGDTVFVTDGSGRRAKFRLNGLSADRATLFVERDGTTLALSEAEVMNITVRKRDSLWNGALVGGIVGASPMLAVAVICASIDSCGSEALAASVFTGAIGAGIGVGIDAMFRDQRLVYVGSGIASATRLSVAPMLSRKQQGLMLQLRF